MEDKKNKRKIFKRIGAIVGAIAVAIVAFVVPFSAKFSPNFSSKNLVASADEVSYSYVGSNLPFLFTPTIYYNGSSSIGGYWDTTYSIMQFSMSDGGLDIYAKGTVYVPVSTGDSYSYGFDGTAHYSFATTSSFKECDYLISTLSDKTIHILFYVAKDVDFNFNIRGFYLFTEKIETSYYNTIQYFDSNNKTLTIRVFSYNTPGFSLVERTYFIVNPTENDSYNEGYRQGYSSGNSAGYSEGEIVGYNNGYKDGETIGYNNGYSVGLENGGNYTFFSLISAVIDAPIQAFMGLFNFELLGINLAGFFTGLLTLAFIITIVRLVMP